MAGVINTGLLGLGLGLDLEAKFSGLCLEAFGLGLGIGLVFLAVALFKAKVKVINILPNTVYHGIITLTVHWYTSVIGTAIVRRQDCLLICRVGMIYIIDIYPIYIRFFSTKKSKISMHEKIQKIDTNIDQTINEKVLRIL